MNITFNWKNLDGSKINPKYKWFAIDQNGSGFVYTNKPVITKLFWMVNKDFQNSAYAIIFTNMSNNFNNITHSFFTSSIDNDCWQTSLQERVEIITSEAEEEIKTYTKTYTKTQVSEYFDLIFADRLIFPTSTKLVIKGLDILCNEQNLLVLSTNGYLIIKNK